MSALAPSAPPHPSGGELDELLDRLVAELRATHASLAISWATPQQQRPPA